MAKRKIPKNYRNITGKIGSNKAWSGIVSYESKLERDFYFLFDYLPEIRSMDDQPITIEYEYNGKSYSYTPDFIIYFHDDSCILGEIKYRDDLLENFGDFVHKFRAAIEYCNGFSNMKFRLFTDRCPYIKNQDLLWNIKFLSDYEVIDERHLNTINVFFRRCNTVGELLNSITEDKYEQAAIVPTLWGLVRLGKIKLDLNHKLSLNTVLEDIHEP